MNEDKRTTCLKSAPVRKNARYVLYWMQMFKRAEYNHALDFAMAQANELKLPLLVYEGLKYYYPYACDRIHQFIFENSLELKDRLRSSGVRYLFHWEQNKKERFPLVEHLCRQAALLVSDDFPAFIIPRHNALIAQRIDIPFFIVDSNGVVPLNEMSKREYAARTIRPKIHRLLPKYLKPMTETRLEKDSTRLRIDWIQKEFSLRNIEKLVASCDVNHAIKPSALFRGGRSQAGRALRTFLENRLQTYATDRNNPAIDGTSNLSPYLHFGMLSSLEVALQAKQAGKDTASVEGFLEELIVRRELSYNFTKFSDDYESLEALPCWVQENLSRHAQDKRQYRYSLQQFEAGQTHDRIWNACQRELLTIGKIHGYMRMYWGKKIIECSSSHAQALETMIYLNNQYGLDGRDPNSWTGILWCFGLHDRPWGMRPIFGSVRFMSEDGLKRKFDVAGYIDRVANLTVVSRRGSSA
jgi:deoxyribodipyrimidine photo-lyase